MQGVGIMKRIVFITLVAGMNGAFSFEPPQLSKEKSRMSGTSSSSSSHGGSGSAVINGEGSDFTSVELHRKGSPQLDTARLKEQGKIVISDVSDLLKLQESLEKQGVQLGGRSGERRSIIYMPQLDLAAVARDMSGGSVYRSQPLDLEKGSSDDHDTQAMEQACDFLVHYMNEKVNNPNIDFKTYKKDLVKKFKKAHSSPPPSPHDAQNPKLYSKLQRRQKTKQATEVLRKASYVQQTARTRRAELPPVPLSDRTREPKPVEIVESLLADKAVQEGMQTLETMVLSLLAERNKQTESSLTNTRYGGVIGALASAGLTALVTYLGTKKSC